MSDLVGQIKQAIVSVDEKIQELESLKASVEHKLEFTLKFLGLMEAGGYTKVSVGRKHKSIPQTDSWPFSTTGSVFGFRPKATKKVAKGKSSGWPPIWGVVSELGISGGAGNSDQHQADTSSLIDGIYHLKQGKWVKVDD